MRRTGGVLAVFASLVAVLALVAVAAVLAPLIRPSPPSGLTGIAWRWIATTTLGDPAPSAVPDPSRYTIGFGPDGRFRAAADCTAAAGSYRTIPPGRLGPNPGLVITPDPGPVDPCGPGSLSEAFVTGLARAVGFTIADGELTIPLGDGSRMTFR